MKYSAHSLSRTKKPRRFPRRVVVVVLIIVAVILAATFAARQVYYNNLQPVNKTSEQTIDFTVEMGSSVDAIANQLQQSGLIRSSWSFVLYVNSKQARNDLQAGTYSLSPNQDVSTIVSILTHGLVATDSVTILPGQRLDQIRETLINSGFSEADVDAALDVNAYAGHPALVDKPKSASLEGYIYPETFHKTDLTTPQDIVTLSLDEMGNRLTPELRNSFAEQGLNVFEGITLASIVEKEASSYDDRRLVAQVYLKRIRDGMGLQADPTVYYAAAIKGVEPNLSIDSPYNTYKNLGLPPGPISNVSETSLQAAGNPADTEWLFFITGDDGKMYFASTFEQHEENVRLHCVEGCAEQ